MTIFQFSKAAKTVSYVSLTGVFFSAQQIVLKRKKWNYQFCHTPGHLAGFVYIDTSRWCVVFWCIGTIISMLRLPVKVTMNNIVENTTEVIHCRWFIARRLIGRFDSISQFFLLFINSSLYFFFFFLDTIGSFTSSQLSELDGFFHSLSLNIFSGVSHPAHQIRHTTQHTRNSPEMGEMLAWLFFSVCFCSATKESHESVFYTVPISARAVVVVFFFSTQLGT